MRYQDDINTEDNMPRGSGQSVWLAMDIRGFETGKAQTFFYYIGVAYSTRIRYFDYKI